VPWVEQRDEGLRALSGPNALYLRTPVETSGRDFTTIAEFEVRQGERVPFTLSWSPSHQPEPAAIDALWALDAAERWWREWSGRCAYDGEWSDEVLRSLIVLKALTYGPTGGIVAAPTTSLPERIGGERNWDYRYCWMRDATLTLDALMIGGYLEEAIAFRAWTQRATAGHPRQAQIMYGVAGERRLPEVTLDWLPGYEGSKPVRVGNAASEQFQLDVYGEMLDAAHRGRVLAGRADEQGWERQLAVLDYLEEAWREPDEGIWEVRGPRRHFTHSKVMAWVGFDRAIQAIERFDLPGPVDRWRLLRDEIHTQVCRRGYDRDRKTFTQYYGGQGLDASLLLIPATGFLPPDDERVRGTIEAVERELVHDGFVYRYQAGDGSVDGLEGGEGAFLPCSFWLVDCLGAIGREDDARALFERLLGLANDVGLLAEEYDPGASRQVGNFPQAFTHLALVNSAAGLAGQASSRHPKRS
jgi:GH15 family glucan-1,4-alpha-glucosidase